MIAGGWWMNSHPIPRDQDVGFDFEAGDFVAPNGAGQHAGMAMRLASDWSSSLNHTNRLVIRFENGGGVIALKKDLFSAFETVYDAPEAGYEKEFVYAFGRKEDKILLDNKLKEDEYLVFKSSNTRGQSNYGKILGLDFGGGWIKIFYVYNPRMDDRNLEKLLQE
jgi:hypothetical protein